MMTSDKKTIVDMIDEQMEEIIIRGDDNKKIVIYYPRQLTQFILISSRNRFPLQYQGPLLADFVPKEDIQDFQVCAI